MTDNKSDEVGSEGPPPAQRRTRPIPPPPTEGSVASAPGFPLPHQRAQESYPPQPSQQADYPPPPQQTYAAYPSPPLYQAQEPYPPALTEHSSMSRTPRSRKKILFAGTGALILGVGTVIALVLTLTGGSGDLSANHIIDIKYTPQATWSVKAGGDAQPKYVHHEDLVAVGDNQALALTRFDVNAWRMAQDGQEMWYEGFEEQYDLGFASGQEYVEAMQAANSAYDENWPNEDSHWPEQYEYYPSQITGDDLNYDSERGFFAGFNDATNGLTNGHSRLTAPDPIFFNPSATLIDLSDGSTVWDVPLTKIESKFDHSWDAQAVSFAKGSLLGLRLTENYDYEMYGDVILATLDAKTGEILSVTSDVDAASLTPVGDALIAITQSQQGSGDVRALRLDPRSLSSTPLWELDVRIEHGLTEFGDGRMTIGQESGTHLVRLSDGKELWRGEHLVEVGSNLVAVEWDIQEQKATLRGVKLEGQSPWQDGLDIGSYWALDNYLFAADPVGMRDTSTRPTNIQRLDPETGKQMWDKPIGMIDDIYGVSDGRVIARLSGDMKVYDLKTGEELVSESVRGIEDAAQVWLGTDNIYVKTSTGELIAHSTGEEGRLWTYKIPDDNPLRNVGGHLVMTTDDSTIFRGIQAK